MLERSQQDGSYLRLHSRLLQEGLDHCVKRSDADSALKYLKLMRKAGMKPEEEIYTELVEVFLKSSEGSLSEEVSSMLFDYDSYSDNDSDNDDSNENDGNSADENALHASRFYLQAADGTADAPFWSRNDSPWQSDAMVATPDYVRPKRRKVTMKTLYKRQLALETKSVDMAVRKYRKMLRDTEKRGASASLLPAQRVLLSWYAPLTASIRKEVRDIEKRVKGQDRNVYGPYLRLLPPEKLAVITIHEILGLILSQPQGIKFTRAALTIGRTVQGEVNAARLRKEKRFHPKPGAVSVTRINMHAKRALEDAEWPGPVLAKIGSVLIKVLLESATVENERHEVLPAFEHTYYYRTPQTIGIIKGHEAIFKLIDQGHALRESMNPRYLPMIVPPKAWTSYDEGGYLTLHSLILRSRVAHEQMRLLKSADLDLIYQSLNALSSTEWEVNEPVFDVIRTVWEQGGGVADLPRRLNYPIPSPPEDVEDRHAVVQWKRDVARCRQRNRDLHSLRCDVTYKLQVAKEFLGQTFYLPHNLDFRGRAYPIPPHLSHLGSDMARGLLRFSQKKPLGDEGLWWLKVHFANLHGKDKLDFDNRVLYTESVMEKVHAVAKDPLEEENFKFWLGADDPWQCLSTCFELSSAMQVSDPTQFMSSLPVHQDGSCNGLQHYAALGRDMEGAKQVDLLPAEAPQDVYSEVARALKKRIQRDAEKGNELAIALVGKIERKIVKQTVMTSVYGVTFVGARKQIQARLEERTDLPPEVVYKASCYLAKETLNSLGELFTGAKSIMAWMNQCAMLIAGSGQPVGWTTPLGLPVVQPYRRLGLHHVQTLVQRVVLTDWKANSPVSGARQRSAFPPNFVHSLDSSHMLMTAISCAKADITFASVHDSYWTHAGTVTDMNRVLRDEFINLHSQPLLQNLLASFQEMYPDLEFPPLPEFGNLDLEEVRNSLYFFD